jgi:hypothetical protein
MHPRKLLKGLLLSFTLGAVLSVASDTDATHQVQRLVVAQAQAFAKHSAHAVVEAGAWATRAVGAKLEEWAKGGMEAVIKDTVKLFEES